MSTSHQHSQKPVPRLANSSIEMPRKRARAQRGASNLNNDTAASKERHVKQSDSDTDEAGSTNSLVAYKDAVNLPAHQTKHLAELVYRFPSIDTSFRLMQRNYTNSTGSSLWLSSQILSSYLLHNYAVTHHKSSARSTRKRVLELGSGTGLLSLLMARLGWQVVATDIPPVLDSVLRPNIEIGLYQLFNSGSVAADQVQVCELDWTIPSEYWQWHSEFGLPSTSKQPPLEPSSSVSNQQSFDLIMTADTIYEPSLVHPLLSTISHLYRPQEDSHPTVLLALERRDPSHITEALRIASQEFSLAFKQVPAKRIRKIFDSLGDGSKWSRDDWEGIEIWKL